MPIFGFGVYMEIAKRRGFDAIETNDKIPEFGGEFNFHYLLVKLVLLITTEKQMLVNSSMKMCSIA